MLYRAFCMFGLGAFFLLISPPLRESLWERIAAIVAYLAERAPWSYCALVVTALALTMVWIHRASRPHL
jgi:hypothetical protein